MQFSLLLFLLAQNMDCKILFGFNKSFRPSSVAISWAAFPVLFLLIALINRSVAIIL